MSETKQYLFFWGHTIQKCGPKAYLSNWYPANFVNEEGVSFSSSEQYMMWRKALLFNDQKNAEKILCTSKPGACKKLGRQVQNFDQDVWSKHAIDIVYDGCLLKFRQNKEMKEFLFTTGTKIIAEASPFDKVWGIGLSASSPKALSEETWKGTNWLGIALMRVRDTLKAEEEGVLAKEVVHVASDDTIVKKVIVDTEAPVDSATPIVVEEVDSIKVAEQSGNNSEPELESDEVQYPANKLSRVC